MSISRPAILSCNESGCVWSCISLQALSKASPMMPIVSASKDRSEISRFLVAIRNGRKEASRAPGCRIGGSTSLSRHQHPPQSLHCKLGEAVRYCSRKPSVRGRQREAKPSGFGAHSTHAWQRGAAATGRGRSAPIRRAISHRRPQTQMPMWTDLSAPLALTSARFARSGAFL